MAANYVLLQETTLNTSASSVTFSSIPQSGYTDLKIVVSARTNEANTSTTSYITFNGSSTGFTNKVSYGTGTTVGAFGNTANYMGDTNGSASTANVFSNQEIYIPNYTGSNYKPFQVSAVAENNATSATNTIEMMAQTWANTSAITTIALSNTSTWASGSSFSLYGIAAVDTTPVIAPKASGGDVVVNDGTYWIHTFYSSGTFIPNTTLTCDYLVVAGGGVGSMGTGPAGGGAGGMRSSYGTTGGSGSVESQLSLSSTIPYTITVGAGGAKGSAQGGNGSSSSITGTGLTTVTSIGGGGGGYPGATGGSGGGGHGEGGYAGGAGTSGQGYAGGNGWNESNGDNRAGGGGGGAAGAGANGASGAPGSGGSGRANSITGTSTTYARGGNGNKNGNNSYSAEAANTGNGSTSNYSTSPQQNNAGSGIVVIRYAMA